VIAYLKYSEIVKRKWDECIKASINGRIYAYSWYLDTVADDWDALVLDDYQAVFPLPKRKKFGVNYVYQPVFTQQLGLFSRLALTSELLEKFLVRIPPEFNYVNLNLNQHNRLKSKRIKGESRRNIEMDLISEYTLLRQSYSKNLKRNLKKAASHQLSIFENLKPDAVVKLFKENKGRQLKVYSEKDYSLLIRLIYKAIQLGQAEVWGAYTQENELCAGAVFFKDHKRITFLFSAANPQARVNGAIPYLLDSFIEAHAGSELIFDFEGSNHADLARFYFGFGAQPIHYTQIQWVRGSRLIRPFFNFYLKFR
jgi:hypothetical protein